MGCLATMTFQVAAIERGRDDSRVHPRRMRAA